MAAGLDELDFAVLHRLQLGEQFHANLLCSTHPAICRNLGILGFQPRRNLLHGAGLRHVLLQPRGEAFFRRDDDLFEIEDAPLGKQKWVPEIQYGGGGTTAGVNSAQTMMDTLSTKALRDLGIDMKMTNRASAEAPAEAQSRPAKK